MLPDTDDTAVEADAYIDALLAAHRRGPLALAPDHHGMEPDSHRPDVRDAIHLLEAGLPRFHPSFVFEEWLAEQLRAAGNGDVDRPSTVAEIIPIGAVPLSAARRRLLDRRRADRRLLVGGAIASGVSIAGAAVIAWRRNRN